MAVHPASPRYQLHDGLYSSQYTDTGSPSSRNRAESSWWMAMSSSNGWSIWSRNPPKWGALKNSVVSTPGRPIAEIWFLNAHKCSLYRRDWLTMNSSPVISAAAASERPCATVDATGFSPSTGRPANSAAVVTG